MRASPLPTPVARGPVSSTYTVQEGDSFWTIAQELDSDMYTLMGLNPQINGDLIHPGDQLQVVEHFRGSMYTVLEGDNLSDIAAAFDIAVESIQLANSLDANGDLRPGDRLLLPDAQPQIRRGQLASRGGTADRSSSAESTTAPAAKPAPPETPRSTTWIWPVTGLITTEFGENGHRGIDIAVREGTPVVAAQAGTITFAGWDGNFGYCIVIDHGGGVKARYAHASAILVSVGQYVGQGQQVIRVGTTGRSTGPHLHFEVLVNDRLVNPRSVLP